MDRTKLIGAVESILFAAEKPITIERLREVLGEETAKTKEIESALDTIQERYQEASFGFEVRKAQGGYQFSTKQENAAWVRRFLETKPFRLSRSALETLAVIAYRQPITRAEVDKVRGIDSSHLVRTLIEKGVIKMAGKADVPGRPVQYATTAKFLELVGLKSVSDLPPLSELKELEGDTPKADPIEEGMDRFIESEEVLDDRQQELEAGLKDIDGLIKSAGKPTKEIFKSKMHAEVAAENEEAATEFQAFSRSWKKPRAAKKTNEEEGTEAPAAEASPETAEALPESVEEAPETPAEINQDS